MALRLSSCLAFSLHNGKLTESVGVFDRPYWDWIRTNAAREAHGIVRRVSPVRRCCFMRILSTGDYGEDGKAYGTGSSLLAKERLF
jgi:hypothetical protein